MDRETSAETLKGLIRVHLDKYNVTQRELADAIGISAVYMGDLLAPYRNVGPKGRQRLVDAMEWLEETVGGDEE